MICPHFSKKLRLLRLEFKALAPFSKANGQKSKKAVFCYNGVSQATWYRILRLSNPRTLKNDLIRKKTCDCRSFISPREKYRMEPILENESLKRQALKWQQLGFELGLDVSEATIWRTLSKIDYHRCLACQRGWQSPKSAANWVKCANVILEMHPESRIEIVYVSMVRFTLNEALSISYKLYASPENNIASIVYNIERN